MSTTSRHILAAPAWPYANGPRHIGHVSGFALPREMFDRYNRVIAEDLYGLDMSYNLFTRTVTRNHYAITQEIFLGLYQNGYIFPKTTLGAISPSTGRTL